MGQLKGPKTHANLKHAFAGESHVSRRGLSFCPLLGVEVERPQGEPLYWSDLDVDLSVESIEHPERFSPVSVARA
jgi:hypothetical protein